MMLHVDSGRTKLTNISTEKRCGWGQQDWFGSFYLGSNYSSFHYVLNLHTITLVFVIEHQHPMHIMLSSFKNDVIGILINKCVSKVVVQDIAVPYYRLYKFTGGGW